MAIVQMICEVALMKVFRTRQLPNRSSTHLDKFVS